MKYKSNIENNAVLNWLSPLCKQKSDLLFKVIERYLVENYCSFFEFKDEFDDDGTPRIPESKLIILEIIQNIEHDFQPINIRFSFEEDSNNFYSKYKQEFFIFDKKILQNKILENLLLSDENKFYKDLKKFIITDSMTYTHIMDWKNKEEEIIKKNKNGKTIENDNKKYIADINKSIINSQINKQQQENELIL